MELHGLPRNLGTCQPATSQYLGTRWWAVLAWCLRVGGGTGSPCSSSLGWQVCSKLIRKDLEVFSRQFRSSPELFNMPLHSTAGRRNWGSSLPGQGCLSLSHGTAVPGTGCACGTAPCCRAVLAIAVHSRSRKGAELSASDLGRLELSLGRKVLGQGRGAGELGLAAELAGWESSTAKGKGKGFEWIRDAQGILAHLSVGAGVGVRSSMQVPRCRGLGALLITGSIF